MFDITKLVAVVKATAAAAIPGAADAIAAAEAVYDLATSIMPTLASDNQAALSDALPELLAVMNRNVDQAVTDLGGTGR